MKKEVDKEGAKEDVHLPLCGTVLPKTTYFSIDKGARTVHNGRAARERGGSLTSEERVGKNFEFAKEKEFSFGSSFI